MTTTDTEQGYEYNSGTLSPPRVWLTLPMPSPRLTPNGTRNRMERHRLSSEAKSDAYRVAQAVVGTGRPFFGERPVRLAVTVMLGKGRKRLDDDGLIAMLKGTIDGLQGPLVTNDRQITWGEITWERRSGASISYVRLELTGAA